MKRDYGTLKLCKLFLILLLMFLAACTPAVDVPVLGDPIPEIKVAVELAAEPATLTPVPTDPATESPPATPTPIPTSTMTATLEPTETPVPSSTPTSTPTATLAPTLLPTDTPVPTAVPSTATSIPVQPTVEVIATEVPVVSPTDTPVAGSVVVGNGLVFGCPIVRPGVYYTAPSSGGNSMDLVNWILGQNYQVITLIEMTGAGAVVLHLNSGAIVDLSVTPHLIIAKLQTAEAILTRESAVEHVWVTQDTFLNFRPGDPILYLTGAQATQGEVIKGAVTCPPYP